MHSGWFRSIFLRVLKFLQIKEGGPNFLGERILQKVWIIWSPILYFNFKSLMETISSSSIRFQFILHDLGILFSESWNVHKLKRDDLISGWNQICRKSELFRLPLCISILKALWTQIHHHFLDSMHSAWFGGNFLRVLKFLQSKEVEPNF